MVIAAKSIQSIVAMIPHKVSSTSDSDHSDSHTVSRFFVVEKPGLDVAALCGIIQEVPEDE